MIVFTLTAFNHNNAYCIVVVFVMEKLSGIIIG